MKILVSACLLGTPCRYDGKEKKDDLVASLAEKHTLIPICPEVMGGLPTPRIPAERCGKRVLRRDGADVTLAFQKGAEDACRIAAREGVDFILLKSRSPSCGIGEIYDGSFSENLRKGDGMTAESLKRLGIPMATEEELPKILHLLQGSAKKKQE